MVTAIIRVTRSSRHRRAVIAVTAVLTLTVLAAHAAPEGSSAHMGMDMGEGAAMCLAVLGGAIGGVLTGIVATTGRPNRTAPRIIHALGTWATPISMIEPVARAGPTRLQVFRL